MSTRLVKIAIAGCAAIALISGSTAAASATEQPTDAPQLAFGYFESGNFEDVYESIVSSNTPQASARFLANAADEPDMVPGLDDLSAQEATRVLTVAASAARQEADLPHDKIPASLLSDGNGAGSIVAPADIDSAPVIGSAINNGRSWQYVDRYNYAECENYPYDCEIVATMDFRFTTDPGETGTRTSLNIVRIGPELSTIDLTSGVFGDGVQYHLTNPETYGAGSWTHFNSPHLTLRNRTFQGWYSISVQNPVGWDTAEYKTAETDDCGDATSGAFVCSFS